MITTLLLALVAASGLAHSEANDVPKFTWSGARTSEYGIPHLMIHFPNGDSDVALLERFNPIPVTENETEADVDPCIFRGYLQAESNVYVTLTGGCPFSDSFEVCYRVLILIHSLIAFCVVYQQSSDRTILQSLDDFPPQQQLSISSAKLTHHIYSVKNGQVTGVTLPWGNGTGDTVYDLAVEVPELQKPLRSRKPIANADFPENGMVMRVKILSDASFRAKFGEDTVNAMRRVMAHAQTFYYMKDTLTTTIRMEIIRTGEVMESITACNDDLELVRKYGTDEDINANVHMCYENDSGGVVGLAWVGTTCNSDLGFRSSINEYRVSDASAGAIVAHEMGHNLGMNHDHNNGGPRFDSKGQPCTGIGGVMDYGYPYKWSTCSVEDFRGYYNWFQTFCLPADDTPSPTKGTNTCF